MRVSVFLIALACLIASSLLGQKKDLTLKQSVLDQWTTLRPATPKRLSWIPGTDRYSYLHEQGDEPVIAQGTVGNEKMAPVIRLSQLNEGLRLKGDSALKKIPSFKWVSENEVRFSYHGLVYYFDLKTMSGQPWLSIDDKATNLDFNDNRKMVAYTYDNNLFIGQKGSEYIQVSNDGRYGIAYGQAVHRSEFGITKGTFWSPKGNKLAYYRMDETMVTDYPLLDNTTTPATLKNIKYPMAGQKSHHVTIGVFDVNTKKKVYLEMDGDPEQYLVCVTWSPSEQYLYVTHVNRDQNHVMVKQYDVTTGQFLKYVFEEKDEKYIEPEHDLYFLHADRANQFLWFSERDGFQHLYLYQEDGVYLGTVTKGEWEVQKVLNYDPTTDDIIVTGTDTTGMEMHAYKVNLKTGNISQLTGDKGVHSITANSSGKYLIDSYSNLETPRVVQVLDNTGKKLKDIQISDNPLADYKYGQTELFTMKAADDKTDLWCRMIKPSNFDANAKYPVFVYLYNGPRAQMVNNSWLGGSRLWMNWLAEQGYVVFTMDGRGSSHRGIGFEQETFRQLGTVEIADQLKAAEWLKSQPYIDGDRMAIHGWSYGGFMAINMMLREPGTFKVGVAGGPVIDWRYYEVMYTEKYMDTPNQNPVGYQAADLKNYVKNLEGDLMLIHGTVDDVVVMQHSLSFLQKCVDEEVQVDFFVYPMHPHNVRGKDRAHLMEKVLNYTIDKLK